MNEDVNITVQKIKSASDIVQRLVDETMDEVEPSVKKLSDAACQYLIQQFAGTGGETDGATEFR